MNFFRVDPFYCFVILLCLISVANSVDYITGTTNQKPPHSNEYSVDYITGTPKPKPPDSPQVHEYTFDISHTVLAPDGFSRRVWTVNGQFPGPEIHVFMNDTIRVNVINHLGDEDTAIHWHGFLQKGTPWFDGAAGITQCGIPTGKNLTYEFSASIAGTYWWHSHFRAQFVDGILGGLVVHDAYDPYLQDYDEEFTVLISLWYHNESAVILKTLTGPVEPDSGLINGRFNYNCTVAPPGSDCVSNAPLSKFKFEKGKKYRLRIINTSGDDILNFSIDKHLLKVIEVDGFLVKPYTTHRIVTSPAQRYSVIVEADQEPGDYFMRADMSVTNSDKLNPNVTAIIHYDEAPEGKYPTPAPWTYDEILDDELVLQPHCDDPVPSPVGTRFIFHVNFAVTPTGVRAVINNSTFIPDLTYATVQKVFDNFTLSALNSSNQNVYSFDKYGEVIELIVQNDSNLRHPFHLHGHKFWILGIGNGTYIPGETPLNAKTPIQRDTSRVPAQGYLVIRFTADNPGVWAFHCHIEWHLELGMAVQLIELPSLLENLRDNEPASVKQLCPYQS